MVIKLAKPLRDNHYLAYRNASELENILVVVFSRTAEEAEKILDIRIKFESEVMLPKYPDTLKYLRSLEEFWKEKLLNKLYINL